MNISYSIRNNWMALLLGVLFLPIEVAAQTPFSVTVVEPSRKLDVVAFTTFEVQVTNTSPKAIAVSTTRTVKDLPGTDWHNSICSEKVCYEEEVSDIPPYPIDKGGSATFKVHVQTGSIVDKTGRIVVRFDAGDGSPAFDQELTVTTYVPPPSPYRIDAEVLDQEGSARDTASFTVVAFNNEADTLRLNVERIESYFPDSSWRSSLCVMYNCYPDTESAPPAVLVEDSHAALFQLRIVPGSAGQGRVVLRFNTTRGTTPVEKRFTVTALPSGVLALREESTQTLLVAPNPVSHLARITLPIFTHPVGNVTFELYSSTGELVGEWNETVRRAITGGQRDIVLDLDDLLSGTYQLRLRSDGVTSVAPVIVVR
jgi:hypothetical protein